MSSFFAVSSKLGYVKLLINKFYLQYRECIAFVDRSLTCCHIPCFELERSLWVPFLDRGYGIRVKGLRLLI